MRKCNVDLHSKHLIHPLFCSQLWGAVYSGPTGGFPEDEGQTGLCLVAEDPQ